MDPFTIALATFGVQKLRGKSTRTALKDAALVGGTTFGIGQLSQAGAFGAQAQAGQGIMGSIGRGGPFSSIGKMFGLNSAPTSTTGIETFNMPPSEIIKQQAKNQLKNDANKTILQKAGTALKEGYGKLGTAEKIGLGTAGISLLGGEDEDPAPPFTEEDYKKAYKEQSENLEGGFQPAAVDDSQDMQDMRIYDYTGQTPYAFNQGGIANIQKFNQGGINYLPSKTDHDEHDYNNYVRAEGYVEDGSGNGDKDEDTMLAQLADGEFVSRADAILGAGIIEGANPKNYKDMRKKGAAFFYGQQAKFKRVFDLIDASKKDSKAS